MVAEAMRIKAEVYHGDKTCREIFGSLLSEIGLPNRLLSNQEIEECGYVKDTGFVWLKHKKKKKKDERKRHQDLFRFDNVVVCFEDEVTAYFQPNTIKKLTGVKAKEFGVWISLGEIHVNRPSEAMRIKAEVYHGDKTCREIFGSLLSQIGLPNRLLSNQEIEECGYVKDTGFVWLKHKKKNKDDKRDIKTCLDSITLWYVSKMKSQLISSRTRSRNSLGLRPRSSSSGSRSVRFM
ncbi:hypothetical protein Bca52824_095702 [Brassica carinata]|uniref:Uncharacterized protein n=1 Tax=Brassica carinata TaxID=52824 RepID=A0A8X7P212_BRACI|nr:hypothetical protein Bca52824_095702 [Brassica carinata]